jgi:predicted XRE-type DNA-binding protein
MTYEEFKSMVDHVRDQNELEYQEYMTRRESSNAALREWLKDNPLGVD